MQTTLNGMEQMKNALKNAASLNSFQIEAQVLAGRGEGGWGSWGPGDYGTRGWGYSIGPGTLNMLVKHASKRGPVDSYENRSKFWRSPDEDNSDESDGESKDSMQKKVIILRWAKCNDK